MKNHYVAVVARLLDAGIDSNIVDNDGRTALDLAVSDPESHSIAILLLRNSASPTKDIRPTTLGLLDASARSHLIEDRGDIDLAAGDRLGCTPLHEAACYGNHGIVSMLLKAGAKVDAAIAAGLGGDTVLHAVITGVRGHRQFFSGHRARAPSLNKRHAVVVAMLPQNGAPTELRRQDGLTMPALVSKELESRDTEATKRRVLEQILMVLRKTPQPGENVENEPTGTLMNWWNSLSPDPVLCPQRKPKSV